MFKMWTRCLISVVLVAVTCAENYGSIGQLNTTKTPQKIQRVVTTLEEPHSILTNKLQQKIQRNVTTTELPPKVQRITAEQPHKVFTAEPPSGELSTTEPGHIPALHPGTKSSKLIYLIVFLVLAHIYFFSNLFICFVYETGPFWRLMVNIRAAFANDYQRMT